MNYRTHIETIENFPEPGIRFYDIAPLLADGTVFASAIQDMAAPLEDNATKIVGLDARGFVFGAAMATELGIGFTMLRKAGKLPGQTIKQEYALEYGKGVLELQADALTEQDRVVLVDDVIATGGTACASIELVRRTGAKIIEFCSAIDLTFLGGSKAIEDQNVPVWTLVNFDNNEVLNS